MLSLNSQYLWALLLILLIPLSHSQEGEEGCAIDVCFALDSSSVITAADFTQTKELVTNVATTVESLLLNDETANLTAVRFAASVLEISPLTSDITAFKSSISSTPFNNDGSDPNLLQALINCATLLDDDTRLRTIVVLSPGVFADESDNAFSNPTTVLRQASLLVSLGFRIFTVGVGKNVDEEFLRDDLATEPLYYFKLGQDNDGADIVDGLTVGVCDNEDVDSSPVNPSPFPEMAIPKVPDPVIPTPFVTTSMMPSAEPSTSTASSSPSPSSAAVSPTPSVTTSMVPSKTPSTGTTSSMAPSSSAMTSPVPSSEPSAVTMTQVPSSTPEPPSSLPSTAVPPPSPFVSSSPTPSTQLAALESPTASAMTSTSVTPSAPESPVSSPFIIMVPGTGAPTVDPSTESLLSVAPIPSEILEAPVTPEGIIPVTNEPTITFTPSAEPTTPEPTPSPDSFITFSPSSPTPDSDDPSPTPQLFPLFPPNPEPSCTAAFNTCNFTLSTSTLPIYTLPLIPDVPFTKQITSKDPAINIGIVNAAFPAVIIDTNGTAVPISQALGLSDTFFKPFVLSDGGSGIGHEYLADDIVGADVCVKVGLATWQVLDGVGGNVVGNMNGGQNGDCVVFRVVT